MPRLLAPLAALLAAQAARGGAAVTTSSSETSDVAAASTSSSLGVCGLLAPACALAVTSVADPTLAGTYDVTGCRQGRPVYTRRAQSGADPPRVLAWAGNASASASVWVAAAAVSASGASGVLLRSNAPHLSGGFQARAAWARPDWLTPEAGHAAWLTAAGAEAPDVAVTCAGRIDTATAVVAATAAGGCTKAESAACELVITASTDDPLVALSGLYPLAGCMGGRPVYTRAATTVTPQMHIAFLVRAGGVWAVTASLAGGAPEAVLLPNPSVWTPSAPGASRPEAVAVSYSSYAHDAWLWSAWPVAGTALETSVATLGRLPALPSPSFTMLCSASAFVRSPPPSAPPAAPRGAGVAEQLRSPAVLGGIVAVVVVAALLAAAAAALLYRRHRRWKAGGSEGSSHGGGGGEPPWWGALHTHADQVVLGPLLGSGGYAEVHAATWRCSPVAAKVLHPTMRQVSASVNSALAKEVLLMSRIRHPNVVSVFGFCLRPPMLLLELGARGSLAALLRSDASPALGWRERCRLAHGVACGLAFLHAPEPPIVHLDVKCENVVLDDGMCPKVSDFGLSALLLQIAPPASSSSSGEEEGASPSARPLRLLRARGCGTPLYSAPELDSTEPLSQPLALDVYCFGSAVLHALAHHGTTAVVGEFSTPMYRFYHRQLTQPGGPSAASTAVVSSGPFVGSERAGWGVVQTLVERESLGWQPELAPRCPPPLADAIRRCCAVDPSARPGMDALRDEMQALMLEADGWLGDYEQAAET